MHSKDKLVILVIAAIVCLLFLGQFFLSQFLLTASNKDLVLEVNSRGERVLTVELTTEILSREQHWHIEGQAGGLELNYEPKRGFYVSEARCPDQICVKTGNIIEPLEAIVCVPNEIVISIAAPQKGGNSKEEVLDGVLK